MKLANLEKYMNGETGEGLMLLAGIALVVVLILVVLIFDRVENLRFKLWNDRYGMLENYAVPWRTIVPWHRIGSRWFERKRAASGAAVPGGPDRYKDPYKSGMNGGFGKGFGNSYGGFAHGDHRRGKGNFGDGRGSGASNYSSGPR